MNALTIFEGNILLWIQDNLRGALDGVLSFLSRLGDHGYLWIAVALLLLFFKKTRKGAICAALSMILTLLVVNLTLKPLVGRIRPYDVIEGLSILVPVEKGLSFPSGHSANGLACAWVLWRMLPRKIGLPALLLAILISLTRLYVGVHYPTDVLAGIAIGIAMAELAMFIVRVVERKLIRRRS